MLGIPAERGTGGPPPTPKDRIPPPSTLREAPPPDSSADSPRRPVEPSRWGHLEILELLGEGAFGEVFRAFDPILEREVALKLRKPDHEDLTSQAQEHFLSEARRLARVRHPNVIVVHGADVHDGRTGLWTDLLEGKTLERHLEDVGPLGPREAALIGLDLCRALSAVHAAGLVHRDVKTSNVMREEGGRVVLMDFGSGGELPAAGEMLQTSHLHGTPVFMAPEQLRGEIAGPPTDVYALGALLYRLVTRRLPIEASSYFELAEKHQRNERVPLRTRRPDLPTPFVMVVEKAMSSDPGERYQTAAAMEVALAATLGTAGRGSSWWKWMPAAALSLLATIVLVWIFVERKERSAPDPTVVENPATGGAEHAALAATATLYRRAVPEDQPLAPGDNVKVGDRIYLSLQGSDSMHVYVLNEDDEGRVYVLFPLRGIEPSNPLSPRARHRLPGESGDSVYSWTVTSAGRRESIIAIASRHPLPALEQEIKNFPLAVKGRPYTYGRLGPAGLVQLRGMGGLSAEAKEAADGRQRLSEIFKDLALHGDRTGDVWFWQSQLRNPPSP